MNSPSSPAINVPFPRAKTSRRPEPDRAEAFDKLERSVQAALETYSNVHRGSGQSAMASTALYERARDIILECLDLDKIRYTVIFCSPAVVMELVAHLRTDSFQIVSSSSLGLPLGITAVAVLKEALPGGPPFQTGGGTVRIVSPHSAVWEEAPGRFEAGTPAIINAIALARALQMNRQFGSAAFNSGEADEMSAEGILRHDEFEGSSGLELLERLRYTLIGRDIRVPTAEGARPLINLDNAASTPTFAPIWNAVCQTWRHPETHRAIVAEVKSICADFLGAPAGIYDVIFTMNATEALNIVARSLGRSLDPEIEPVVLNTLMEHNSNELPWRYAPGVTLLRLAVDSEGFINLPELERLLCEYNEEHRHGRRRIMLIAASGASNVLGAFNSLGPLSRIAHRYGARLLVDAAQLVAHRHVAMAEMDIDFLAFSGHKVYAPFGSGALVARKGLLNLDGRIMRQLRASGEENVAGIAALGKALVLLQRVGLNLIEKEERILTERALSGLDKIPGVTVYGIRDPGSPRLPQKGGIIAFALRRVPHNLVAQELAEEKGIGVRSGCFCAHLLVKRLIRIHPARARAADLSMKWFPRLTAVLLPGLVRMSLGVENSEAEIDTFVRVLRLITQRRRSFLNRVLAWSHNGTPFLSLTSVRKKLEEFVKSSIERVFPSDRRLPRPTYTPPAGLVISAEEPWRLRFAHRRCCGFGPP